MEEKEERHPQWNRPVGCRCSCKGELADQEVTPRLTAESTVWWEDSGVSVSSE